MGQATGMLGLWWTVAAALTTGSELASEGRKTATSTTPVTDSRTSTEMVSETGTCKRRRG